MKNRWLIHSLLLALIAGLASLLCVTAPEMGDDFTYWNIAFELHERGLAGWSKGSFHALRWPVWGVCWIIQGVLGFGMAAYTGVGLLYLAAGAVVCFHLGRLLLQSIRAAWACGIAFIFHPLLDTICAQPMPDLSEGVWSGAAMLCWWALMQEGSRGRAVLWAVLAGSCVFVLQANRLTGVFIVPVMILCTLLYFPRRIGWLVAAGVMAIAWFGAETLFYHGQFGDSLYSLHTNMRGKGVAGTEPVPLWFLPLRFLETLWSANPWLSPFYAALAVAGAWAVWSGRLRPPLASPSNSPSAPHTRLPEEVFGRVIVIWFVLLYLEYACAPQSLSPWRPVVRVGSRFIASLAVPMSVLSIAGLLMLLRLSWVRKAKASEWIRVHPLPVGAAACVVLSGLSLTTREFFSLGYLPEVRQHLRSVPPGTKIYSHPNMRALMHIAAAEQAQRFTWMGASNAMLLTGPNQERAIAQADEFWYIHSRIWIAPRKQLERKAVQVQEPLASCFIDTAKDWRLTRVVAIGSEPDLVFHRRRAAAAPPPRILTATSPELHGLLPPTPAERVRDFSTKNRSFKTEWPVAESLRGRPCRLEVEGASDEFAPARLLLIFKDAHGNALSEVEVEPRFYPVSGRDFPCFHIPQGAERCKVEVKFNKRTKRLFITSLRLVVEEAAIHLTGTK
ncbi:MAG TPA: hypothetical protein VF614_09415 [Chthoniobacteraceae bacterium]|jgi:hypothetical protein